MAHRGCASFRINRYKVISVIKCINTGPKPKEISLDYKMEYNQDNDKDGKCTREGFDQRMRVEFINHPELKTLDRKSVENLEQEYKDYKIQLQAQSGTAKPVPRALCVPLHLRGVIAMENSIEFGNLTQEKFLAHLDMVKMEGSSAVQVDATTIF